MTFYGVFCPFKYYIPLKSFKNSRTFNSLAKLGRGAQYLCFNSCLFSSFILKNSKKKVILYNFSNILHLKNSGGLFKTPQGRHVYKKN